MFRFFLKEERGEDLQTVVGIEFQTVAAGKWQDMFPQMCVQLLSLAFE